MRTRLDIGIARNVHLNWETEIEAVVRGGKKDISLQSHEDCELGLWLHATGIRKYGHYDATRQLVNVHRRFHKAADQILSSLKQSNWDGAETNLQEVRDMSQEIVFLLTEIELSSLERQHRHQLASHPIQSLFLRLFGGPFNAIPADSKVLEVSHARLVHLLWTRGLSSAFGTRGRNSRLEPAETCALGVWIHSVGLLRHPEIVEMVVLDNVHKFFHAKAEATVLALSKKNDARADKSYAEMLKFSREAIYLLSMIEFKLLSAETIVRTENILD